MAILTAYYLSHEDSTELMSTLDFFEIPADESFDETGSTLMLDFAERESLAPQIRVEITKENQLSDFSRQRIPIYYIFENAQDAVAGNPRATPPVAGRPALPNKLTLVAGPGVAIKVHGIDPHETSSRSISDLIIDIYRVQDPHLVPTQGTAFSSNRLLQSYVVNTAPPAAVGPSPRVIDDDVQDLRFYDTRFSSESLISRYNDPLWIMVNWYQIRRFDTSEYLGRAFVDSLSALFSGRFVDEEGIDVVGILSEVNIDTDGVIEYIEWLPPVTHIEVQPLQNGVQFTHGYSTQILTVNVRKNHLAFSSAAARTDHQQRFAYQIEHNGVDHTVRVKIVKTENVEVQVSFSLPMALTSESRQDMQRRILTPVFEVYNTAFENIPPQGTPLPTTGLTHVDIPALVPEQFLFSIFTSIFDVMIGFIPVLGDAADIIEFWGALHNGRDRWGRNLETWEKAVMGVGVVISLIGPSLSALRRVGDLMGGSVRALERTHSAVRGARFTREEEQFLVRAYEALSDGRRLADDDVLRVQELLRRMPRCTA